MIYILFNNHKLSLTSLQFKSFRFNNTKLWDLLNCGTQINLDI